MTITVPESLAKFESWRSRQYPQLAALAVADEQRYQALVWIDRQWSLLWAGPDGYKRAATMIKNHGDGPRQAFLADKQASIEGGLLDAGERYLAEFRRLELQSV